MIVVERIYEDIRNEGLCYGLPMTFVQLGTRGTDYDRVDELLKDIVDLSRFPWVCITGPGTIGLGLGSLVKALTSSFGLSIELEVTERVDNLRWISSVTRLTLDYNPDWVTTYNSLTVTDQVRFTLKSLQDVPVIEEGLQSLKDKEFSKYILIPELFAEVEEVTLYKEALRLASQFDKVRLYRKRL